MTLDFSHRGRSGARRWLLVVALAVLAAVGVLAVRSVRSPSQEDPAAGGDQESSRVRVSMSGARPAGAVPDARSDDSREGQLVAAALGDDPETVRRLLDSGVSPDARSGGTSALHRAAQADSAETLELLIARGAHIEALDSSGSAALGRAALFARVGAARRLLAAGADPSAAGPPNDMTPLAALLFGWTLARSGQAPPGMALEVSETERLALARLLIEAGADPAASNGTVSVRALAAALGHPALMEVLEAPRRATSPP